MKKIIALIECGGALKKVSTDKIQDKRLMESITKDELKDAETVTLEAKFMDFAEMSANDRFYNKEAFMEEFYRVAKLADEGKLFGSADHPEDDEEYIVKSGKIACIIEKLWFNEEEDACYVRLKLVPTIIGGGHDLIVVTKNGGTLSVSLRALGVMDEETKEAFVDSIYTIDVVAMPGFESASTRVVDYETGKLVESVGNIKMFESKPRTMKSGIEKIKESLQKKKQKFMESFDPKTLIKGKFYSLFGDGAYEFIGKSSDGYEFSVENPDRDGEFLPLYLNDKEDLDGLKLTEALSLEQEIANDLLPKIKKVKSDKGTFTVKDLEILMKNGGAKLGMIDNVMAEIVNLGFDFDVDLEESAKNLKEGSEVLVRLDGETEAVMDLVKTPWKNRGMLCSIARLEDGMDFDVCYNEHEDVWVLDEADHSEELFEAISKKFASKAKRLKESKNKNMKKNKTYKRLKEAFSEEELANASLNVDDLEKVYNNVSQEELSEENEEAIQAVIDENNLDFTPKDVTNDIKAIGGEELKESKNISDFAKSENLKVGDWKAFGKNFVVLIADTVDEANGIIEKAKGKGFDFGVIGEANNKIYIADNLKESVSNQDLIKSFKSDLEKYKKDPKKHAEVIQLIQDTIKSLTESIEELEEAYNFSADEAEYIVNEIKNGEKTGIIDRLSTKIATDKKFIDGQKVLDKQGFADVLSAVHKKYYELTESDNILNSIGIKPEDYGKAVELMKSHPTVKFEKTGQNVDGYDVYDVGNGNNVILALSVLQKGGLKVKDTERMSEAMKPAIKMAKELDFSTEQELFDYIEDSRINGQRKQAKELYMGLDVQGKKDFQSYAEQMGYETKHLFESIELDDNSSKEILNVNEEGAIDKIVDVVEAGVHKLQESLELDDNSEKTLLSIDSEGVVTGAKEIEEAGVHKLMETKRFGEGIVDVIKTDAGKKAMKPYYDVMLDFDTKKIDAKKAIETIKTLPDVDGAPNAKSSLIDYFTSKLSESDGFTDDSSRENLRVDIEGNIVGIPEIIEAGVHKLMESADELDDNSTRNMLPVNEEGVVTGVREVIEAGIEKLKEGKIDTAKSAFKKGDLDVLFGVMNKMATSQNIEEYKEAEEFYSSFPPKLKELYAEYNKKIGEDDLQTLFENGEPEMSIDADSMAKVYDAVSQDDLMSGNLEAIKEAIDTTGAEFSPEIFLEALHRYDESYKPSNNKKKLKEAKDAVDTAKDMGLDIDEVVEVYDTVDYKDLLNKNVVDKAIKAKGYKFSAEDFMKIATVAMNESNNKKKLKEAKDAVDTAKDMGLDIDEVVEVYDTVDYKDLEKGNLSAIEKVIKAKGYKFSAKDFMKIATVAMNESEEENNETSELSLQVESLKESLESCEDDKKEEIEQQITELEEKLSTMFEALPPMSPAPLKQFKRHMATELNKKFGSGSMVDMTVTPKISSDPSQGHQMMTINMKKGLSGLDDDKVINWIKDSYKHFFSKKPRDVQYSSSNGYFRITESEEETDEMKIAELTEKLKESEGIIADKDAQIAELTEKLKESDAKDVANAEVISVLKETEEMDIFADKKDKIVENFPLMECYSDDDELMMSFDGISESAQEEIASAVDILSRDEIMEAIQEEKDKAEFETEA